MTLLTSTWVDDDGSGSKGTPINNAELQKIYANLASAAKALPGGRLSLTSLTPATSADQLAATTLYYTPYVSDVIVLYDGSATWNPIQFSELTLAVPATTFQLYDVFVYNNAGTAALEVAAWTNDTTRGTPLVWQNGVLVRSGATTRRYVGSFRTTGVSGQAEDSAARRHVWNYYNRLTKYLRVTPSNATWTYGTPTWRASDNGNAAFVLDIVNGANANNIGEEAISVTFDTQVNNTGANITYIGIGEDVTTFPVQQLGTSAQNVQGALVTSHTTVPGFGRHYYAGLEFVSGGTTTFTATANINGGLRGLWRC